jgi:hypothetical protein
VYVLCFVLAGYGGNGGLGHGKFNDSAVPVPVVGGKAFTQISAGVATCGLEATGSAWCWDELINNTANREAASYSWGFPWPDLGCTLLSMQEVVSRGSLAMGATMTLLCPWPYLTTSSLVRLQLAGLLAGWQTIARHGAGVRSSLAAEHCVLVIAGIALNASHPALVPALPHVSSILYSTS